MCVGVCITKNNYKIEKLYINIKNKTGVIQRCSRCYLQNNHRLCTHWCG